MKLFEIFNLFLTAGALTLVIAGGYYLLISPFIRKEIDEFLRRTVIVQAIYVVLLLVILYGYLLN